MPTATRQPDKKYIMVLLRGGGFRPCLVTERRIPNGSEIIKHIERQQECYQSASLADAEAEEWAERENLHYRRWPA